MPNPLPPWPTLMSTHGDEAEVRDALARIEAIVGPCPQAELLEPWDADEGVGLRLELPNLTAEQAAQVRLALPEASVEPGLLPGAREARDRDLLIPDVLEGGGLVATLWSDSVEGGLVLSDLVDEDPDPAGAAVASELVASIRGVGVELVPDPAAAVSFVRDRTTGRRGWRLQIPSKPLDRLAGDALNTLRLEVISALGTVVKRRETSEVSLSWDGCWDPRLGLAVVLWRAADPGPALPGDSPVPPGLSPPAANLRALDVGDRLSAFEVQVVPASAELHGDLVDAVIGILDGSAWVGGPPRWSARTTGAGPIWSFAPTWRVPAAELRDEVPRLEAIAALDQVYAVRVLPAPPIGLEDQATFIDPVCYWTGARFLCRWRDGTRGRDRLPAWVSRPRTARDVAHIDALHRALARVPTAPPIPAEDQWVRPICDDVGRHGLALHWPADLAWDGMRLAWVLGAVGGLPLPGLSDAADLALPADAVVVQLWYRHAPESETGDVTWVAVG